MEFLTCLAIVMCLHFASGFQPFYQLDLAIVLDAGNGKSNAPNWPNDKQFVNDIVSSLQIGKCDAHVALITFGNNNVITNWDFSKHEISHNHTAISSAVNNLQFLGGSDDTLSNVVKAATSLFGDKYDRKDVSNVVIFLTRIRDAGKGFKKAVKSLHKKVDLVLAITLGVSSDHQQLSILTRNEENIMLMSDFDLLQDILSSHLTAITVCKPVCVDEYKEVILQKRKSPLKISVNSKNSKKTSKKLLQKLPKFVSLKTDQKITIESTYSFYIRWFCLYVRNTDKIRAEGYGKDNKIFEDEIDVPFIYGIDVNTTEWHQVCYSSTLDNKNIEKLELSFIPTVGETTAKASHLFFSVCMNK